MILPFYSVQKGIVYYLNQAKYLDLNDSRLDSIKSAIKKHERELVDYGIVVNKPKQGESRDANALFIEPHPDDIALSCGAYFLGTSNKSVLTIFSRGLTKTFPWRKLIELTVDEYQTVRETESDLAIRKFANCENKVLGWGQAVLRGAEIPFSPMKDSSTVERIKKAVLTALEDNEYTEVVGPSAIGNHTDHIAIYVALNELNAEGKLPRLLLYEDMPYSRNRIDYVSRIAEIKANANEVMWDCTTQINDKAALISIYKSQFDDFNYSQLTALARSDGRVVSKESKAEFSIAERLWVVNP